MSLGSVIGLSSFGTHEPDGHPSYVRLVFPDKQLLRSPELCLLRFLMGNSFGTHESDGCSSYVWLAFLISSCSGHPNYVCLVPVLSAQA